MTNPMHHIAIMKKQWGLIEKILTGEKTLESRWYKNKYAPWDRIKKGDIIYFKNSGKPVSVKAEITKVIQYSNLTEQKRKAILKQYGQEDLGTSHILPEIEQYTQNKNYCVLVFFKNPEPIKPFDIDKAGFGAMASWLVIDNIKEIKICRE